MHYHQQKFTIRVRETLQPFFFEKDVLDIGSQDINGNNRFLFFNCQYTGIDIGNGKNVDVVSSGHLYKPEKQFDVVISTECLEHDMYYRETIQNVCNNLLKSGGLFLMTCASTGRPEHGTNRISSSDSPITSVINEEWSNYYKNLTEQDFRECVNVEKTFSHYYFEYEPYAKDLYFFGIKK
jgi:SAM-dependent methyltransferase